MIEGWKLNPDKDVVHSVRTILKRNGGYCPCVAQEEWGPDTKCPCLMFRSGEGCHCRLYVKE